MSGVTLLGPVEIRELAGRLGVQPTKKLGQNFVVDANTVRKIVTAANVAASATGSVTRQGTSFARWYETTPSIAVGAITDRLVACATAGASSADSTAPLHSGCA